ncbi:MAG: PAS domain S-box protein [Planctomycetota bacterium]|nr:MAG: PAS domain S-box protein [Planctomycetota bacterium]
MFDPQLETTEKSRPGKAALTGNQVPERVLLHPESRAEDSPIGRNPDSQLSWWKFLPFAVVAWDETGRIRQWNRRAEILFGFHKAEVWGRRGWFLWPDASPGSSQNPAASFFEGLLRAEEGASEPRIHRNRDAEGRELWCRWYHLPQMGEAGQAMGWISWAEDVSETMATQQALAEREQQYRNLVETSQDLIWSWDDQGRWEFVNQASRSILGYEAEALVGHPFTSFQPIGQAHKDWELFRNLLENPTQMRFETIFLRKDGTPVHLSMNCRTRNRGENGKLGVVGTASDVTARYRTQRRLREQAERNAVIASLGQKALAGLADRQLLQGAVELAVQTLEADMASFWEVQGSGRQLFLSAGMGWDAGLVGKTYLDLHEVALFECCLRQGAVSVEDWPKEERFQNPRLFVEQGIVSVLAVASPGPQKATGVLEVCCRRPRRFSQDDTVFLQALANVFATAVERRQVEKERQELIEQVLEAQKLESLGVLAGGIAHDFNNILVGVLGNADLALERSLDPVQRDLLVRIKSGAERAAALTRQMLAFSGKGRFLVQELDLAEEARRMQSLLEAPLQANQRLEFHFSSQKIPVIGDRDQIHQLFMNLVTNAAEALQDEPKAVKFRLSHRTLKEDSGRRSAALRDFAAGTYAVAEVLDRGCGMDPATQDRIFEPFFSTKFTGRGLGMAAVSGIVRGHQGAIEVFSASGKGTLVRVWLPGTHELSSLQCPGPEMEAAWILVADDDEGVRQVCSMALEHVGFRVKSVADAKQVREFIEHHHPPPQVALLDLSLMPASDLEELPHLSLFGRPTEYLIMSGRTFSEAASVMPNLQADRFLSKPFSPAELIQKIQSLTTAD